MRPMNSVSMEQRKKLIKNGITNFVSNAGERKRKSTYAKKKELLFTFQEICVKL